MDAHNVLEGHLPSLVPMDYVEHIIIKKSAYDKIMSDPVAKNKINNWKRLYDKSLIKSTGRSFIEVVEGPNENDMAAKVKKANDEYLFLTKPLYAPTGYTFVMCKEREHFMPIKFKEGKKKIFIYFMACGGNFSVSVSGISEKNPSERNVATFVIDGNVQGASAYFEVPLSANCSVKVREMLDFNIGCPMSKYVHYVLCIDRDASTLTLKHWGSSTYFNNKTLTVRFWKWVTYRYLSFTSFVDSGKQPQIWNLNVEYSERKCNIPPLPTEDEVIG